MSVVRPGRRWLAAVLAEHWPCQLDDTMATLRLPRFQRDAAVRLLDILARQRAALLADGVGLGKTHVAGAVIRSRSAWRPALIVAPAVVRPSWEAALGDVPEVGFASYAGLALGKVDPPRGGFRLIVFDEAHRLRNPKTKRYRAAAALAPPARLLFVTASPVHNSADDLAALVRLAWPGAVTGKDDLEQLRGVVTPLLVRRTRWTVCEAYTPDQRRVAGLGDLPIGSHLLVEVTPSEAVTRCLDELPTAIDAALPDRSRGEVPALVSMVLARRLESSPAALRSSLQRCRNYLVRAEEASRRGERLGRRTFRSLFGDDPVGQVSQYLLPFFFGGGEPAPVDWLAGLPVLDEALERLKAMSGQADPKLGALRHVLRETRRTTVVMTSYRDTARWLFDALTGERWLLTGEGAWSSRLGRLRRRVVLERFGAGRKLAEGVVLIATDVLGEGVNLQAAEQLVHYDRPWNPVVTDQRFGRIDRLGAGATTIQEVVLRMGGGFEAVLQLEERLSRKRRTGRRVFAGPPEDENLVGLDVDGLLMACAALLEAPLDNAIGGATTAPRGRLIAVRSSARLVIYHWEEGELRPVSPRLLVALAAGRIDGRALRASDAPGVSLAARQAHASWVADRLMQAEPGSGGGATLARARALGGAVRGAFRRGDVASVRVLGEQAERLSVVAFERGQRTATDRVEVLGVLELERQSGPD